MPNRQGAFESEAYQAATLRSEQHRIVSLLVVLALALVLAVARTLAINANEDYRLLFYVVLVALGFMAYEVAFLAYLRRARQRSRPPGTAVWQINVFIECAMPTVILIILVKAAHISTFWSLTSPTVLVYYFFIIASTLRLSPLLSILTGVFSAAGYLVAVALAFAWYGDSPAVDDALPITLYGTYAAFLLLGGLAAAGVSKLIRTHVITALTEAQSRQRFEHDLDIARSIQQGLLPRDCPAIGDIEIAGWSQPADQTGGDYFDWQVLPNGRLAVSLADVSGHGIGPALVTAVCRAYGRASFPNDGELAALVGQVNNLLVEDLDGGRFVTFVVAVLDTSGTVDFISAGHGPIVYYSAASDEVELLDAHAIPLGIAADMDFGEPTRLTMAPGDALLLVTDGFVEWANPAGDFFGNDRLMEAVRGARDLPAERVVAQLYKEVTAFAAGTAQLDDLTAVAIKRRKQP